MRQANRLGLLPAVLVDRETARDVDRHGGAAPFANHVELPVEGGEEPAARASRVTTSRRPIRSGGLIEPRPWMLTGLTRIESRVGRTGIGPRRTGAVEISRMTLASRTT